MKYITTFGCICSIFLLFDVFFFKKSVGFLRYGKNTSKIHICFMQLSLFILPLLRFMCSQMGELSCIQLLWRAIIVKK